MKGKMKRKRSVRIICIAVAAAALAALALWYTRPMSFHQLCPNLDPSEIENMSSMVIIHDTHPDGKVDSKPIAINITKDNPAIQELLQILEEQTFHRSLTSLLFRLNTGLASLKGAYIWDIAMGGGCSFHISTGSSKLNVQYEDDAGRMALYCTIEDQEEFERTVYELLAANIQEKS